MAQILSPAASAPNELHQAIADLASSSCARIVTTNYDRHLSTALGHSADEYIAPALPVGSDFQGLVYLHGALPRDNLGAALGKLIITDRDFGIAYLTDAWAARFLERMFSTYPTLFIGYSHDDVIMKYLARGLSPQARPRFILTDKPDAGNWKQLNIIPIGYSPADDHRALSEAIGKWAAQAGSGLVDRRRLIESIVTSVEPQSLSPEQTSRLEDAIADERSVTFVCDHAQGQAWLDWFVERSVFRQLFEVATPSSAVGWRLATWFARTYVTPDMSGSALNVARAAGGHLGSDLWDAIARQLTRLSRGRALPDELLSWIVLLIRDAPENEPFLEVLLSKSSFPTGSPAALALFAYLTEPQLRVAPHLFGDSHFEVRFHANEHWLRQAWEEIFKPNFPEIAPELLAVVDQQIRRAQRDISLVNGPGARSELMPLRGSITLTGERTYRDSLDMLVDCARDGIESMLDADSKRAESQLGSWADSDVPLLRRLAVHGWTYRSDVEADAKIEWLSGLSWILDYSNEPEVTALLAQASTAGAAAVDGLITQLVAGADEGVYSARRAIRFLHSLGEHGPFTHSADAAIATLLERHEDLKEYVAPDPGPSKRQPVASTQEDLQSLVQDDPAAAVRAIQAQAEQEPQIRWYTWNDSASQLTGIIRDSPLLGFALLNEVKNKEEPLRPAVVRAVVRAWRQCALDGNTAGRVVAALLNVDLRGAVDEVTLMLMPVDAAENSVTDWASVTRSQELAVKCWDMTETASPDADDADWPHIALNHSAGRLAMFWIRVLEDQAEISKTWNGLPPVLAAQFESMLQSNDGRSEVAEVIFARAVGVLHKLDPTWCDERVLPLFTWELPSRANRVWSGLLWGAGISDKLLEAGMLEMILSCVEHHRDLQKQYSRSLFGLCASIALNSRIQLRSWVARLARACDLEGRIAWANEVAEHLQRMSGPEVEEQWSRWMCQYWEARLVSVPRMLSFQEASAMAAWVVYLTESVRQGVELVVKQPAGFTERTFITHRLSDERIQHAPNDFARLVIHLLTNAELPFYGYDLPEIAKQLREAK